MICIIVLSLSILTVSYSYLIPIKGNLFGSNSEIFYALVNLFFSFIGALGFTQVTAKIAIQMGNIANEYLDGREFRELQPREQDTYNKLRLRKNTTVIFIACYEVLLSVLSSYIAGATGVLSLPKWAIPFNDLEVVDTIYHICIASSIGIITFFLAELYILNNRKKHTPKISVNTELEEEKEKLTNEVKILDEKVKVLEEQLNLYPPIETYNKIKEHLVSVLDKRKASHKRLLELLA
jgi:hypothetical protein